MRYATPEELDVFTSLKGNKCPPGHFIGDGRKVVRRMLAAGVATRVVCAPERVAELAIPEGVEVCLASQETLESILGYRLHAGVMALGRIPPERAPTGTLHVALDGLANAENVGAILRTCAAFGVDGVIVGPGTSSPWLRRAVRVSLAAPLVVPVHTVPDLADFVRCRNAWAAHIQGNRRDYRDVDYREPVTLVLGSEATGVTEPVLAACRGVVYIPMADEWDCLNVAASAAVLLSEARRQRDAR